MEIEIKRIDPYNAAFIFHTGSFDKIPEILGKLVGWIMSKGVKIQMPIYGTYYNSPHEVSEEELQWEVGAAFIGELNPEGEIQIKKVPAHQVVATVFKGPYGEAASVYSDLVEFAINNGYQIVGPITESYLNSPEYVPESELLTEVSLPVKKI